MIKLKNGFTKNILYLCLVTIISLGLMIVIGYGCSGDGTSVVVTPTGDNPFEFDFKAEFHLLPLSFPSSTIQKVSFLRANNFPIHTSHLQTIFAQPSNIISSK